MNGHWLAICSATGVLLLCTVVDTLTRALCGLSDNSLRLKSALRFLGKVVEIFAAFAARSPQMDDFTIHQASSLMQIFVPLFLCWCSFLGREQLDFVMFAVARRDKLNWPGYILLRIILAYWALAYYTSIHGAILPVWMMAQAVLMEVMCDNLVSFCQCVVYIINGEDYVSLWKVVIIFTLDTARYALPLVARPWKGNMFLVLNIVSMTITLAKVLKLWKVVSAVMAVENMEKTENTKETCFVCGKIVKDGGCVTGCGHFLHKECAFELAIRKKPLCSCGKSLTATQNHEPIAIPEHNEPVSSIFRKVVASEFHKLTGYTLHAAEIRVLVAMAEKRRDELMSLLDDLQELDMILDDIVLEYEQMEEDGDTSARTGYEYFTDEELLSAYTRLSAALDKVFACVRHV